MQYWIFFIFWNLVLIIFPLFLSFVIFEESKKWQEKSNLKKIYIFFIFLVWVLFFPNIPYLFTEVRHITDFCYIFFESSYSYCMKNSGISIALFFYSNLAIFPFVVSIENISKSLKNLSLNKMSLAFPMIIIPISSIGIMLGLNGRFNSWEIFYKADEILLFLIHEFSILDFLLICSSLLAIYFVFKKVLQKI